MRLAPIIEAVPARLVEAPADGVFDASELDGLPEPVQGYFAASIAEGTPLARSVRLEMTGRIKIGRWVPFRAVELLTPDRGFVWAARAAGLIVGSDRYIDGTGGMEWKLAGLLTVMRADGPDVSRSAAGRAVGEALWLPTAALPRFGVAWVASGSDEVGFTRNLGEDEFEVRYKLDPDGRLLSTVLQRWGDPDGTGTWGLHPFGGDITCHRAFNGLTIPSAGRFGWFYGTERWADGEFFRYEVTALEPVV